MAKRLVDTEQTTSEMTSVTKGALSALVRLSKLIGTEHLVANIGEKAEKLRN